ncbi:MAG TPA: V-type ATP synthase subunit I [Candidatus Latescibacteria bacterium]|nr:V-type ATP synthase subunit I [Candidatus Latescibacterota bacterium]
MAVSSMQKIQIFGHVSVRDRIIGKLQDIGIVHVVDVRDNYADADLPEFAKEAQISTEDLENTIAGLKFASEYLKGYEEGSGLLSSLAGTKISLTEEEYTEVCKKFDYQRVVRRCYELEARKTELASSLRRLSSLKEQLEPWGQLQVPLEEIKPTKRTQVFIGTTLKESFDKLQERLLQLTDEFHAILVGSGKRDYIVIFCSRERSSQIGDLLSEFGFSDFSIRGFEGRPQEIIDCLKEQIESLISEQEEIDHEGRQLAQHRPKLLLFIDYYSNLLRQKLIQQSFASTSRAFMIEGWIKKRDVDSLRTTLEGEFEAVRVLAVDPLPGEEPPVILENKREIQPFEMITDLYGTPSYFEVDPTPVLAPFFILFLGMCLTDAGYGLVVTLLSLLALKFLRLGKGMKRLFHVSFWGGLGTMGVGILTGGYFGIDFNTLSPSFETLKRVRERLMLFSPLDNPLTFLKIALIFGFVHVCTGILIRFYRNIRDGRFMDALLDQVSWLVLLNGLVLFGLGKAAVLEPGAATAGKWIALTSGLIIVLFAGRDRKGIIGRLGTGLFSLYNITGYFGDVLSYSRLLALGMATGVIALVVNTMAKMVSNIPVIGFLAMVILLVVGHMANIGINILSGFIHTMRLQFVEFFGKFFEGNGKRFDPFERRYQFVLIASPKTPKSKGG